MHIFFTELDSLIMSKMERTNTGVWSCLTCDYQRNNRGDVANHVEAKHVEFGSFGIVSCDYCGFVTKTRKALKMHVFRMHVKKQRELDAL